MKMRTAQDRPWFRRKGTDKYGRKRYVLEKRIAGKIYSIALNPEKLWKMLSKNGDDLKEEENTDDK